MLCRYDDIPSPAAVKAALLTKVHSRLRPEGMRVWSYETHVPEAQSVKYRDYHIHIIFTTTSFTRAVALH